MNSSFEFRVTNASHWRLDDSVLLQIVGAFTLGTIHFRRVESTLATYEVNAESTGSWTVRGTRKTERNDSPSAWKVEIYLLLTGFFRSGFSFQVLDDSAPSFPGNGQLTHPVPTVSEGLTAPFHDHFPDLMKKHPVSISILEDLVSALSTNFVLDELLSSPDWIRAAAVLEAQPPKVELVRFKSELSLQLDLDENGDFLSHKILGFIPIVDYREPVRFDDVPTPARTWGEAWLKHDVPILPNVRCLAILPDEIAILAEQLYRYQILDKSTLTNPDAFTFGKGKSKLYDCAQWLAFARNYSAASQLDIAQKCVQQAKKLAQTDLERAEIQTVLTNMLDPQSTGAMSAAKPRRRKLEQLSRLLSPELYLAIKEWEEVRELAFAASDHGRYPIDLPGIDFHPITDDQLLAAEIPLPCLSKMVGEKYTSYPSTVRGLYNFTIKGYSIWGIQDKGCYFFEAIPDSLFFA